jgi:two-component system response regulator HydG
MRQATGTILVVDDDADMCETLATDLVARGFEPSWCTSADEAFLQLSQREFDVVVTDLQMGGMSGIQLCERIVANRPDIPVIVITAFGSLDTAVAAIRAGAYDFLTKPFEFEQLALTVERAVGHRALQEELRRLRLAVAENQKFNKLVGASASMRQLFDMLARVGETDTSVLITGESGTGKELVARALHERSRRREGPFVAINCAAMPEGLFESELFGHTKGAFTDAKASRPGLFLRAHEGTLFLDEIGDMPLGLQSKLLRALQERKVRPVGGDQEYAFDARIVAATNRDLEGAVEKGRFREDLYFRLNVIQIAVPPLRGRGNDVLVLAQHFLEGFAARAGKSVSKISTEAADKLLSYFWPGNVRELENCMERAVALARYDQIVVDDLPEKIRDYETSHVILASDDPADLVPMDEVERRYILRVLKVLGGNKSQAAKVLGYDRKTLYRRLERYGIEGEPGEAAS